MSVPEPVWSACVTVGGLEAQPETYHTAVYIYLDNSNSPDDIYIY